MSFAQLDTEPVARLIDRLQELLPGIVAALVLLVVGWLVGVLLRAVAMRLFGAWSGRFAGGLGRVFRSRDVERSVRRTAADRPVVGTIGTVVFWAVFLLFAAAATEALGLPVASAWLSGIAGYLPRVLAAVLVVLAGVLLGNLVGTAVTGGATRAGVTYASLAGRVAQGAIVTLSVVVAFDQLGLEVTFLIVMVAIVAAGLLGGAALAFGLGARTVVGNILSAHYLLKTYRVGHRVRIGDVEGSIVEITPTAVMVRTEAGRVLVPASEFSERVSTLLGE